MSREIKFRGWNSRINKMIDLKKITPLAVTEGLFIPFVNYVTLMQYTGLKDKNGKDIYEGDILTFDAYEWNRAVMKPKSGWEYPKWVVEWDNEDAGWLTGGGLNKECSIYKEVIGNIYENPELINGSH